MAGCHFKEPLVDRRCHKDLAIYRLLWSTVVQRRIKLFLTHMQHVVSNIPSSKLQNENKSLQIVCWGS